MIMLLLVHILVALGGLAVAAAALVKLSEKLMSLSYALTAGTLLTGTGLVIASGENILKNCLSGLLYLVAVLVLTSVTKRRLAAERLR